jgi:hypothetical protein
MRRGLIALLCVNLFLSTVALGWLTWVTTSPRTWFSAAYAAQGPVGEQGPRGERGPVGSPGPVGPDAASAIEDLDAQISDIEARVSDLTDMLESLQDESSGSVLETDLQETRAIAEEAHETVTAICDQMLTYDGALGDIYVLAC